MIFSPASEVSREVANLTERKNPHTPVYGVKEFVCLSVTKFNPNYLRTGKTAKKLGLFRPDLDSVFRLKSNFKHKNNNPGLHHSQGGMKFAMQMSPLLN